MTQLTNGERAALRRAIAAHPDWPAYRRLHNVDTSSLGAARALDVARAVGVDVNAALNRASNETENKTERTNTMHNHIPAPIVPAGLFGGAAPIPAPAPASHGGIDASALAQTITAAIAGALAGASGASSEQLAALSARVSDLEAQKPALLVLSADGATMGATLPATRHPQLETLIRVCSARKPCGQRLNAWLAGPAGSGKTTAAKMAADAIGLPFAAMGAMTQAHELLGFVDAGGRYHETPFTRFYRDGGVILLDEIDASDANITLVLNGALDNGQMTFPNGETVARHADFVCIGAANTWGAGATADYVGRNKLDGAFLQRFVQMAWDYDAELEMAISGNPDFTARVQKARKRAADAGLKILITPRASLYGAALIRAGLSADDAARMTYLAGLSAAQIKQIEG
jgi:cobaltochelatase CobS